MSSNTSRRVWISNQKNKMENLINIDLNLSSPDNESDNGGDSESDNESGSEFDDEFVED